jgi:hypothetical protein
MRTVFSEIKIRAPHVPAAIIARPVKSDQIGEDGSEHG